VLLYHNIFNRKAIATIDFVQYNKNAVFIVFI